MLVKAWAQARPKGWNLWIAGPDEAGHRLEVEHAISAAGLTEIISFLGPLEGRAKQAAFCNADLFVLPSHSESFGMVIAEALAHRLPVLTTTATPWPMLRDYDCGWYVDRQSPALRKGYVRQHRAIPRHSEQWVSVAEYSLQRNSAGHASRGNSLRFIGRSWERRRSFPAVGMLTPPQQTKNGRHLQSKDFAAGSYARQNHMTSLSLLASPCKLVGAVFCRGRVHDGKCVDMCRIHRHVIACNRRPGGTAYHTGRRGPPIVGVVRAEPDRTASGAEPFGDRTFISCRICSQIRRDSTARNTRR